MTRANSSHPSATTIVVVAAIAIGAIGGIFWWLDAGREVVLDDVDQKDVTVDTLTDQEVRELVESGNALLSNDAEAALQKALQVLVVRPVDAEASILAGQAAANLGDEEAATEFYDQVPEDEGLLSVVARGAAGDIYLSRGNAVKAEERYLQILDIQPDQPVAHERLADIYLVEGRRWESMRHLGKRVQQGPNFEELLFFANRNEPFDDPTRRTLWLESDPSYLIPRLGATTSLLFGEIEGSITSQVRTVLEEHPDSIEAHAQMGLGLSDDATIGIEDWFQSLPDAAYEHPDVWLTLARSFKSNQDLPHAIRCYYEVLRRDPNHLEATYSLAGLLGEVGNRSMANQLNDRATDLHKLREAIRRLILEGKKSELIETTAAQMERLKRHWEAYRWLEILVNQQPERRDALAGRLDFAKDQAEKLARDQGDFNALLATLDLEEYPLAEGIQAQGGSVVPETPDIQPSFQNQAAEVGIDFRYENGDDRDVPGMQLFQSNSGGVAAIDFDLDGWPDLFFNQGGKDPQNPSQDDPTNRLYRNVDGQAVDVSFSSALTGGDSGTGFGQGVAAGDFNNDGFPDLFVANIGENRLYQNNGDGTFSDVSETTGINGWRWSTSAAIADLDNDGDADILELNYLEGERVFREICRSPRARVCRPNLFEAEPDRYWLNNGDGTFTDASDLLETREVGRGLGVVVGHFTRSPSIDVFIANDMSANHLWETTTATQKWRDVATLAGLSFSDKGLAQACMGVAVDDFDRNGLQDLFVTNFFNEFNSCYLQRATGLYSDESRRNGIGRQSLLMLGFGTQAIDFQWDGWPDLAVANGHIDDFSFNGTEFAMRPQLFANQGGKFVEWRDVSKSGYFETPVVGRAMAKLDWNRDGLIDFVVTHLTAPAALLINQSELSHPPLQFHVVGTRSQRDAIGARVTVKASDGELSSCQVTAGSGFHASNEPLFGIATRDGRVDVVVTWPSGELSEWAHVEVERRWKFVEGAEAPLPDHGEFFPGVPGAKQ
jgi:tetratricopeptide (TPR) repeat protein